MECEKVVATTVQPAARPALVPDDESSKTTHCWGAKPSSAAPARNGCGWGLPWVTLSAVMSRSGTGMPLAARRKRPSRSVALVTTVQRSGGRAARSSCTPGSTLVPSPSASSMSSMTFSSAALSRSGRSVATVSMARQPWVMLMAYSGSTPRSLAHLVQLLDRAQRGDEDAVHIEENALAADLDRGRSYR